MRFLVAFPKFIAESFEVYSVVPFFCFISLAALSLDLTL